MNLLAKLILAEPPISCLRFIALWQPAYLFWIAFYLSSVLSFFCLCLFVSSYLLVVLLLYLLIFYSCQYTGNIRLGEYTPFIKKSSVKERRNKKNKRENIAVSATTRGTTPQPNEHANIAKAKQGQINKVERKTGSTKILRTTTPLNKTHSISIQNPRHRLYQHCHTTGGICGMGPNITFCR